TLKRVSHIDGVALLQGAVAYGQLAIPGYCGFAIGIMLGIHPCEATAPTMTGDPDPLCIRPLGSRPLYGRIEISQDLFVRNLRDDVTDNALDIIFAASWVALA